VRSQPGRAFLHFIPNSSSIIKKFFHSVNRAAHEKFHKKSIPAFRGDAIFKIM